MEGVYLQSSNTSRKFLKSWFRWCDRALISLNRRMTRSVSSHKADLSALNSSDTKLKICDKIFQCT